MDQDILLRIIAKWGTETQINKIQEELLELSLVLNQLNCPTKDPKEMEDKLYNELADVKIMMAQAYIIFDEDRINARVKYKLSMCAMKYLN